MSVVVPEFQVDFAKDAFVAVIQYSETGGSNMGSSQSSKEDGEYSHNLSGQKLQQCLSIVCQHTVIVH
jgi:hypothetical protein